MFAFNVIEDELEECTSFCRERGLGIELTAFAYPKNLDDLFEEKVELHRGFLEEIDPVLLHGPFFDLFVTSPDPAIVEICKKRHEKALDAAIQLGAEFYIAHVNSIPIINNENYRKSFVQKAVDFWIPLADNAGEHGITIVLENMWEPDPSLQKAIVRTAMHSHLKASFDNGHALVFSDLPATTWIEELGHLLVHCHLHDNNCEVDSHLSIGEGKENWKALLKAISNYAPRATLVMESDLFQKNRQSLQAIQGIVQNLNIT